MSLSWWSLLRTWHKSCLMCQQMCDGVQSSVSTYRFTVGSLLDWNGLDLVFHLSLAMSHPLLFWQIDRTNHLGKVKEVVQNRRKKSIRQELKGQQLQGCHTRLQELMLVGRTGLGVLGTEGFNMHLCMDLMVLNSGESQVCHCPDLLLSLGSGANKALFVILLLWWLLPRSPEEEAQTR